jgi:UDP-N-acetylglucosamine transferase subunit ALG13
MANFNSNLTKKRVLVAPLDWGLGHASRCIPIIKELLSQNAEVIIAASNQTEILLKHEFPQLQFLRLFGYNVKYASTKLGLFVKMLVQIPHILGCIKKENKWLKDAVKKEKIDIIISDNRYGLYNANCKTIFVTHQLHILTGNSITDALLQKINYYFIQKYNSCWVVDSPNANSLAGKLSQPKKLPNVQTTYIGTLSRLQFLQAEKTIDILAILSGPEPQRSILQRLIIDQLKNTTLKAVIVCGSVNETGLPANKNITIINFANSEQINDLLAAAKMVISRSGYTSIMDYAATHTKALLVPTPGQTEQEYLGKYLAEKGYCITVTQVKLNILQDLEAAASKEHKPFPKQDSSLLVQAIAALF